MEVWTNLKEKITKLTYLSKNKALIRDALEIYLNQSSSFTALNAQENIHLWDIPTDYQINPLTEPTVAEYNPETNLLSEEWKEYLKKQSWNSYLSQKKKNERIVRECKELLEKLGE